MSDWSKWAVAAAVPALAYAVGIAALPRPRAVADERVVAAAGAASAQRTEAPKPNQPTLVVLDDAVEILGADAPTTAVQPGGRLPLTFHFRAREELDRDWQIFVHIDARRGTYRIHGDHFPVGGTLQTTLWTRGSYVSDAWEKLVPRDAPPGEYDVWIGFYIGDDRMPVTGGDTTRDDGQDRVRVATIRIE